MENIIDYIEENLYSDFTIEDISEKNYISIPHLYRIFGVIVGLPIMSYIRRRKLSDSIPLLKEKKLSILDIAIEIGFESHEAYTRAFKKLFGFNPSKTDSRIEIVLFSKFDVNHYRSQIESEVKIMHTEIIIKEECNLYVKKKKMNQAVQSSENLIDKFRTEVMNELKIYNKPIITAYEYDIDSLSKADEDINYIFFAGIEQVEPIKGYELLNVKSSKYAKFVYNIEEKTINGIRLSEYMLQGEPIEHVYDFIDGVWILESGYELSESYDLEIWDTESKTIIYLVSIK
jgi:AraC family transcriptional regulator